MSKSKKQSSRIIDSAQVLEALTTVLRHRLPLELIGTRITEEELYAVLAYASVNETSLHTACQELASAPSGNRVREVLMAALPERRVLQRQLNSALRSQVPRSLWKGKRSYCLAVDITLIPYHGQALQPEEVLRAQAKAGTNQFHGYATVSIVHDRQRYVLALRFVQLHERMVDIVRDLLKRVRRLKIRIRRVYLDKEFYSVDVLRTLKRRHLVFILPIPVSGKHGGVAALCRGRKSYRTTYTVHSHQGRPYEVPVALVKRNRRPQQRKVIRWFVFALGGLPAQTTPQHVFELYRQRFGIESSYRQMNRVRARTSTRDTRLRLLWVGLALLLVNLYVLLRRRLGPASCARPCARRPSLSLQQLADQLAHAIEASFGSTPILQYRPIPGFS